MQLKSTQIKQILSTVAEDDMTMVGPTIVDEIIERELEQSEITFTRSGGGYNLDTSELIISSLSLMVSMISLMIDYWSYRREKMADKNTDEIDQIIVTQHPEYLEISIKDRKMIIHHITSKPDDKAN